jgi:hypothetical protein
MQKIKASTLMILGLSITFYLFFDFSKHAPALGAVNPFAEDPYDAVGSFGIQLTFVSVLLALIRTFRPYADGGMPPAQLLLVLRAKTVALLSILMTLVADIIGLVRSLFVYGVFPAAIPLALLLCGMILLTLTVGWMFARTTYKQVVSSSSPSWTWAGLISGMAILILAFYPLAWRNSSIPGGIFTALTGMVLLFITVWGIAMAIFPGKNLSLKIS